MAARFVSAKYDVKTRTVDYASSDGSHLLRTGGTVAWRFNNPGNLRPTKSLKPILGAIGVGTTEGNGSFLIFSSYEEGRTQKKALLRRKFNNRTIYTMLAGIPDGKGHIVEGYAPEDDNNDPQAYAQAISDHTGLPTTTKLSDITDSKLELVMDAMEKKEGFHGRKETRKEKLIATTSVTISDGALPKPDVPVRVQVGDKTYEQKTDKHGQLPKIAHTKPGATVTVQVPDNKGGWHDALEFVMDQASAAYVLFHDLMTFSGSSAPKLAPRPEPKLQRTPIRHVVAPKETLGKIADRFETTIPQIQKDNPDIKDPSKIYVGQVIGIYGPVKPLPATPRPPARPSAIKEKPPATATEIVRSKKGEGAPIAVVPANQKEAPWMVAAIAEAKTWAGKKEKVITKTTNYHKKIGQGGNLGTTPWCASFVNFCLKDSGTPFEASASSQFPVSSKKFVKITKPVYGALMVMRNYVKGKSKFAGTGHVTFVYAKTKQGKIAGLGGNQSDSIKLSEYASSGVASYFTMEDGTEMEQRFHGFYIPATYIEYANTQDELETVTIDSANKLLLTVEVKSTTNEGTR